MIRVEVTNFQSVAHEVVEIDGFSALVGKSNIGKSAVVRAIKAALEGAPVDSYVRHSADCPRIVKNAKSCHCSCSVHIQAPGLDLFWEKGDAVNRYVYNGVDKTAVSRGTPDFLLDAFGPAKIGTSSESLQISDQFNPIFILNKSGTVVADVLSDVVKLEQINTAIRLAEKDRKEASSTRKVRERDIIDLRVSLARYDGLDESVRHVLALETMDDQVQDLETALERLEHFVEEAYGMARRIKVLDGIRAVEVPACAPAETALKSLNLLSRLETSFSRQSVDVAKLDGVDAVVIPAVAEAVGAKDKLSKMIDWNSKLDVLRGFFERAKGVGNLDIPEIAYVETSRAGLQKLSEWGSKMTLLTKAILDLEQSESDKDVTIKDLVKEMDTLGVCPTCHRAFSVSHEHIASL